MISRMVQVTCPSCYRVYRVSLDQKVMDHSGEPCSLSCHACQHVWVARDFTPVTDDSRPSRDEHPTVEPGRTDRIDAEAVAVPPSYAPEGNVMPGHGCADRRVQPLPQQVQAQTYATAPQQPHHTGGPVPQQDWVQASGGGTTTSPGFMMQPPPPFVPPRESQPVKRQFGLVLAFLCFCGLCATLAWIFQHKKTWSGVDGTSAPYTGSAEDFNTSSTIQEGGVAIRDVRFDVQYAENRQSILVLGVVDNLTTQMAVLQPLRISVWGPVDQDGIPPTTVKDAHGDCLLTSWQYAFEPDQLTSKESRTFQTVGSLPSHLTISRVDVTLP